jgi:hypothetical protein
MTNDSERKCICGAWNKDVCICGDGVYENGVEEDSPHQPPVREDWKIEFREYFDKTLKPKKPTMKNLDREILVDFIRSERLAAQQEIVKMILEKQIKGTDVMASIIFVSDIEDIGKGLGV